MGYKLSILLLLKTKLFNRLLYKRNRDERPPLIWLTASSYIITSAHIPLAKASHVAPLEGDHGTVTSPIRRSRISHMAGLTPVGQVCITHSQTEAGHILNIVKSTTKYNFFFSPHQPFQSCSKNFSQG